jgi:hypothetical protein
VSAQRVQRLTIGQSYGARVRGPSYGSASVCFTPEYVYVTTLGSYDVVISIVWLEPHEAILNYKMKRLSLVDDEGQRRMIVGLNRGVSLRFISSS